MNVAGMKKPLGFCRGAFFGQELLRRKNYFFFLPSSFSCGSDVPLEANRPVLT